MRTASEPSRWGGKDIAALREHMDVSQTAFGEKIGLSRQHVYNLEYEVTPASPTLELLLDRIADEVGYKRKENQPK